MSRERIVVNGRELTAFDLPPEPTDEYTVNVDGLGEITVRKGEQPSERDVPAEYMRKMVAGLCEQNSNLYRENHELRELVRHMLSCIVHVETSGETVNYHCDTCKLDNDTGNCDFRRRARELGVEVQA